MKSTQENVRLFFQKLRFLSLCILHSRRKTPEESLVLALIFLLSGSSPALPISLGRYTLPLCVKVSSLNVCKIFRSREHQVRREKVLVAQLYPHSFQPHGLQPARLLCPWDFPVKNTGVGCYSLLQGIFPTQGLNPHLLYWQADSLPSKPSSSQGEGAANLPLEKKEHTNVNIFTKMLAWDHGFTGTKEPSIHQQPDFSTQNTVAHFLRMKQVWDCCSLLFNNRRGESHA